MSNISRPRYAHQYLDDAAAYLCAQSTRAADYLSQAPVLIVLVARTFGSHLTYGEADRFVAAVASGPKLKQLLSSYGAHLPIRQVAANALKPDDAAIIDQIGLLGPSTLAQVVPFDSQRVWLDGIRDWMRLRPERGRGRQSFCVRWIASRLSEDLSRHEMVGPLVDAVRRGQLSINPSWSWDKAIAEMQAWHRRINDERAMAAALLADNVARTFDEVICKAPLPDQAEVAEHSFVVLRTVRRLREEGVTMHHCVSAYATDIRRGKSAIVSVRRMGVNVATLEISKGGSVAQLKGVCNQAVPPTVRAACDQYALLHWRPELPGEAA